MMLVFQGDSMIRWTRDLAARGRSSRRSRIDPGRDGSRQCQSPERQRRVPPQ
jgi:hypothetical protein